MDPLLGVGARARTLSARRADRARRGTPLCRGGGGGFGHAEGDYRPPEFSLADVELGERLGSGAFAEVFQGTANGEPVVLKRYAKKRGRDVESLYADELHACRRLQDAPGVAEFLGVAGADVYLVWRFEGTQTLADVMERGALPEALGASSLPEAWRALAEQLLSALAGLHARGIVHRDVKPANIVVTDAEQVRLIDLGAAADLEAGVRTDEAIFDRWYGAPEQFEVQSSLFGEKLAPTDVTPSPSFDAYSAGLVLLQAAVPALATEAALRKVVTGAGGVFGWYETAPEADCELLDADDHRVLRIIEGLTEEDPEERMGVEEALAQVRKKEKNEKKEKEKKQQKEKARVLNGTLGRR